MLLAEGPGPIWGITWRLIRTLGLECTPSSGLDTLFISTALEYQMSALAALLLALNFQLRHCLAWAEERNASCVFQDHFLLRDRVPYKALSCLSANNRSMGTTRGAC